MYILPAVRVRILLPLILCTTFVLPAAADQLVTKPEAEAMVKKTVAYIKTNGRDKTYAEINRKDGPFTDRDLYITIYGNDGVVRAHGANLKMINRNLMEIKDVDGKEFVRERIELARKNAPFWQEYKFTNPLSKKTEPKAMYCQPHEDLVVCGGVYIK
ncbi:cache domain-containing protein [Massilia sp. P8910]|uniref:cache domain-containing protein n=1 Tax=Massilia antarctica TaxID=2765360 RepID=UPI0006BDE1E9|nr:MULTISPECIES: cache domain-containing protein [Massilia]MCE3602125.1 cache domain-containing protein [Massilia antarctica]MCY0910778.1 cache domain-containing protein [Massilia sp. H27-R4]CUI08839.1 Methyl-accepting chemotaxis protein I (serine chemoreceptor protein) [Janthinobacterium sp. CG23_2]CUU32625.1 Methyl-accepting chemotaxis protein I (serine chemoreceptor protein) [Janthinobacterium sp. CG23_2]